jgi:uncharacterized membrane protein YfhO
MSSNLSLSHQPITDHQHVTCHYHCHCISHCISTRSTYIDHINIKYPNNVPQACIIPYTIIYASNICQYHKDVLLTMNHNSHIQCTNDMSQSCINDTKTWTSTICNHKSKGPPTWMILRMEIYLKCRNLGKSYQSFICQL